MSRLSDDDLIKLARELWWPHHPSRERNSALAALDAGDIGTVTMEFADILNIVRRVEKDCRPGKIISTQ